MESKTKQEQCLTYVILMFLHRSPWTKPLIRGVLRWNGLRSRMWSCLSSCRERWRRRRRPVVRPEPRWPKAIDDLTCFPLDALVVQEWKLRGKETCLFQIIAAEGEMKASRALKEASLVIAESPSALQLRYLQTLNAIAAEKNSTIVFPLPIDVLQNFMQRKWRIRFFSPLSYDAAALHSALLDHRRPIFTTVPICNKNKKV